MDQSTSTVVPQPEQPSQFDWLTGNQALQIVAQAEGQWCRLVPISFDGSRYGNTFSKEVMFLEGVFYFRRDAQAQGHPARTDLLTRDYSRWQVDKLEFLEEPEVPEC